MKYCTIPNVFRIRVEINEVQGYSRTLPYETSGQANTPPESCQIRLYYKSGLYLMQVYMVLSTTGVPIYAISQYSFICKKSSILEI